MPQIAFKKLNADDTRHIVKALLRGDKKRFQDVISRIGGIDASPFIELFDFAGSPKDQFSLHDASPALAIRTLSVVSDEVYDELLGTSANLYQALALVERGLCDDPTRAERFCRAFLKTRAREVDRKVFLEKRLFPILDLRCAKSGGRLAPGPFAQPLSPLIQALEVDEIQRAKAQLTPGSLFASALSGELARRESAEILSSLDAPGDAKPPNPQL